MTPENTDDPKGKREQDGFPPEALPIPADAAESSEEEADDSPDFSNLLRSFDDAHDLDDQVASELDDGIEVDDTPDFPEEGDQAPLEFSEMVEEPRELSTSGAGSDDFGPTEDGGAPDPIEALPEPAHEDDSDGVVDDVVMPAELGEIGAETEEDESPPDILAEDIGLTFEDEPEPSTLPWVEVPLSPGPARSLVVSFRDRVIAAGPDISAIDDAGFATTLVHDAGNLVTSLLPTPDGELFYTTNRCELFHVDPRGRERVESWARAFEHDVAGYAVELGGMTPSSRPALLLRVAGRRSELLESTDRGTTFRRVDLGGQVLAVSGGSPPVCVVRGERATRLLRSESTGGFSATNAVLRPEVYVSALVAHGDIIALSESERGLQVSVDGGRSFRAAEGIADITALAAGFVGGRPAVFAASFDEPLGNAKIAHVDAVSGQASVVGGIDSSDDEEDHFARIVSLAWNEHTETLWCAGAFGLRRWRRPPSA